MVIQLADLGRMYVLVSRTEKGMVELRDRFEKHVLAQGIASVERYHETALSVSHHQTALFLSVTKWPMVSCYFIHCTIEPITLNLLHRYSNTLILFIYLM